MDIFDRLLSGINSVLWHDYVIFTLLGVGILFTLWSGFSQFRALTHGVVVISGKYDDHKDPGAISHFQALSAALSATVGLGNIAGVALALSLGGPGAVFWMWVTGFVGMALKLTEVLQAMLYRNVDDPENPHGGAMWVVSKGMKEIHPKLEKLGKIIAVIFCLTLLTSTVTGGNMFQAWNVADITREYFGVSIWVTGIILTLTVGLVILGGIQRIGSVTGMLVPFMCGFYLIAGLYVIISCADQVPALFRLIIHSAFNPTEAQGAFIGGVASWAFMCGMQRALFSNEAGQGSAPIAHSAARTDEPVREAVVAGLEPFIDTLCVCTITALVILLSGSWNRAPEAAFVGNKPQVIALEDRAFTLPRTEISERTGEPWVEGDRVYTVIRGEHERQRGSDASRLNGAIERERERIFVEWEPYLGKATPTLVSAGVFAEYKGATLTAKAFDTIQPGLGYWLVPAAAWLFAVSTIISWSYYGEQGIVYLFGNKAVKPYRLIYCALILVAASPLIRTEDQLSKISSLGTGVMLFANIPIMLIFGKKAMTAYHSYIRKLKRGDFDHHAQPAAQNDPQIAP